MSITKLLARFQNKSDTRECDLLNVEVLEERMMLSSVEIFAAGATGQENLDLLIDGQFEQTFFEVGGDASTGQFQRLTFETNQTLTPGRIGIGFSNDLFDASTGFDRNLFVDRIVVDGVTVQAEDPTTFSTGIYRDGLTGPGFLETDVLNINGVLTFADPEPSFGGNGDRIEFDALGTTGEEFVDIFVNDQSVAYFELSNPGVTQTFTFNSTDTNISIEDVRLEFVNDLFDPSRGVDRNVQIFEYRVIDGDTGQVTTARTTDANVLNSGIFANGSITQGFGAGGFIAGDFYGNGFVQIDNSNGGGGGGSGDRIEFDALGTTGEEFVDIFVNGESVAFFGLDNAGVTETFSFTSNDSNISIEDVRLEFVNDLVDPSRGIDRNVQIFEFRVIDGDTGQVTSARTTDANVLTSGIFVGGGITQGFGTGGFIAGDFQGNGFVEIRNDGSGVSSVSADPNFQTTEDLFGFQPAVGPGDQIATAAGNLIQVAGSNGAPLSSFGGNGSVNLSSLLNLSSEFQLSITDLEFFNDGSILATGFTEELGAGAVFGQGPALPVIAKLNPNGTLDGSFSQQGFLQGTFLQLIDNGSPVQTVIDPSGRIIVFGTNVANQSAAFDPDGSEPTNFVVARLNADGSVDSSFGNSGNAFILGSSFPNSDFFGPSGEVIGVDVLDNGEIVFAFTYRGFGDNGPVQTVAVGRLGVDGFVDQSFADNGFFVRTLGADSSIPLFQLTPSGGSAIVFDSSTDPSGLLLLDAGGNLVADRALPLASEVLNDGTTSTPSTTPTGLAIDPEGNIFVSRLRTSNGGFTALPSTIQRILPSGQLDDGFGLGGSAILDFTGTHDIIFDSQNRLIVAGSDRTRFLFS